MLWGNPDLYPDTEAGFAALFAEHPEIAKAPQITREKLLAVTALVKAEIDREAAC